MAPWADKIDRLRGIGWSWKDIATALAPDLGWNLPGADQNDQWVVLGERLRIAMRGARAAIAASKLKPMPPAEMPAKPQGFKQAQEPFARLGKPADSISPIPEI